LTTVSKSEFARLQSVSRQRVSQWIKSEIISVNPDGLINLERATKELLKNRDEGRRIEWQIFQGKMGNADLESGVVDYLVVKQFIEKIGGDEFVIPKGTILRVYGAKGSNRIQVAFFPPEGGI